MRGVILCAGYGSRFFPITKTIPKEMLPLYNLPSIHFAIQELMDAGIKEVVIVTSRRKKALDDYFDIEFELETFFKNTDRSNLIKPYDISVAFVRQKQMKGVGNALLEASSFIGDNEFILLYPDDIVISIPSLSKRLVEVYKKTGKNVLSLLDKTGEDVSRFGVARITKREGEVFEVGGIVEKPSKGSEPSSYITIGRYLFTPEVLHLLKKEWEEFGKEGEFYHISSINKLCAEGKVVGIEVGKSEFFDTGTPNEYVKSFIRYALEFSEDRLEIRKWLKEYIEKPS